MTLEQIFISFQKIETTPKRLEMQALLAQLYAQLSPEESAIVSYLLIGRIVPEFISVEFQISDKTLQAVVSEKLKIDINEAFTKYGDIGTVWEKLSKNMDSKLTLIEYYELLWNIAKTSGTGSQKKKQELISLLLDNVSPLGGKYTIRILNSKLRLGASDRTILDALGKEDGREHATLLRDLYAKTSDLGYTVELYKIHDEKAFDLGKFAPGVPVSAKLVEREESIEDIFERIPEPIEEPKYDGLRIQIHVFKKALVKEIYEGRVWSKNYLSTQAEEVPTLFADTDVNENFEVKLFSRNLEDMTEMFPEVVEAARKLPQQYENMHRLKVDSLVLDGEVIGYNDIVEEYLPFQETMKRKRKYDVSLTAESVPVKVFSFDILLVNGESLMRDSLSTRKQKLSFLDENRDIQKTIVKTPIHYPKTVEESEKLFLTYVAEGLEGVIYKNQESLYTPGTRNFDWIKYKKAMQKDLADTVDVVLLGYYRGEGKLAEFGIGALLAGVYDENNNRFLTVTKIGTGITHEQWKSIKIACDAVRTDVHQDISVVPKSLVPDVWLTPSLVVEVEADEITKSPLHTSGYALRFPRFKKFREKKPEQATTVEEISKLCK